MRLRPAAVFSLAGAVALVVVVGAACGGGDGAGVEVTRIPESPTAGSTEPGNGAPTIAATGSPATRTATMPTATATMTPGSDGKVVLACGDILVPVDKDHRLPADCAPDDLVAVGGGHSLRAEAASALRDLQSAATAAGHDLPVQSAYRSYRTQVSVFNAEVERYGLAQAERQSARPGHSEHQLGTTADLGQIDGSFGDTPAGRWLAENANRFGFVISYPPGKEAVTGYIYEPWHVRYVGKQTADAVRRSGLTLHEYLLGKR